MLWIHFSSAKAQKYLTFPDYVSIYFWRSGAYGIPKILPKLDNLC